MQVTTVKIDLAKAVLSLVCLIAPDEGEPPLLLDHTFYCEQAETINMPMYFRRMNVMELAESNAAFGFSGRTVRKAATQLSQARIRVRNRPRSVLWRLKSSAAIVDAR